MNQSELNALLGKTVLIRGGEHFCCAVGNDRLLLLQYARRTSRFSEKVNPFSTSSPVIPDGLTARLYGRRARTFPLFRSLMV